MPCAPGGRRRRHVTPSRNSRASATHGSVHIASPTKSSSRLSVLPFSRFCRPAVMKSLPNTMARAGPQREAHTTAKAIEKGPFTLPTPLTSSIRSVTSLPVPFLCPQRREAGCNLFADNVTQGAQGRKGEKHFNKSLGLRFG